jgi:PhnB protein
MASTSIYLNFNGNAEAAFLRYQKVFNTSFSTPISRMGDIPRAEGMPVLSDAEKQLVMHVALPLLGGMEIMGTDILESMGHRLIEGNNLTINLNADSRADADRFFQMLQNGTAECVAPHETFWGYWGTCKDHFGIRWMFNVPLTLTSS